ncbi:MAG: DUF2236 domain-containing protein [Proteobacteria bacterium]|nr:DUF2236 domain-containing protein [Pseudomonadota bacterium]
MPQVPSSFTLPSPLQHRLEALSEAFIEPAAAPRFDFAAPPGEPALVPPDSVSWRVFKNPLTLFIGGVAAVLLELAEPRVREGVWRHSGFRSDPLGRIQRTGLAAMVTVYGPRSRAEAMIAGVVGAHARVAGVTPEGQPYAANDPDLLTWVHATAAFGFMEAYRHYARPLSPAERDGFLSEAEPAAKLYGALGAPRSRRELQALFDSMRDRLTGSPVVFEFLEIMAEVPLPGFARPLQPLLIRAAVDTLPPWVARRLELEGGGLKTWERPVVRAAGLAADRLLLRSSPAVQACRRLGLGDTYLYGRG